MTFYVLDSPGTTLALGIITMPRIPRRLILEEGFQTHKMWRSHNKERNLESNEDKASYLNILNKELKKQSNELNAYATMSNHAHELFDIKDKSDFYDLMRNHHSKYGRFYNDKHDRRGKVAYERPKTCLIGDENYSMTATFYIHANPLRAGMVKNAADYPWSTHKLYAFGKRNKFNRFVKFPKWYMELGKTPEERQRKYRKLFDAYLRAHGLISKDFLDYYFFGGYSWTERLKQKLKQWREEGPNAPP